MSNLYSTDLCSMFLEGEKARVCVPATQIADK